jgi:Na+/H+ antiporter NhaC
MLLLALAVVLLPFLLGSRGGPSATALLPALVTLAAVIVTQRVVPSMLLGWFVGSLLQFGAVWAIPQGVERYFLERLLDPEKLCISGFAVSVLLTVKLAEASGGMRGIIAPIKRRLTSARATQVGTAGLGLLVFFDDYANTMLVGPAVRPICDRQGVSREKLAYLVDSTAAPVAGLALVSTWLGYEVGLLQTAVDDLGVDLGGYALLLSALPQRFYCLFALSLVFVVALLGRDFGPMWRAEAKARRRLSAPGKENVDEGPPTTRWQWLNAALPIALLALGVLVGFVFDGGGFERLGRQVPWSLDFWTATLTSSRRGPLVLLCAGSLGLAAALTCALGSRALDVRGTARAVRAGVRTIATPIAILYCAWALAGVAKDLETGAYLVALLEGEIPLWSLPVLTFLLASGISFATGTSFGTMGILIPAALPLAHQLGGVALMIPTTAAVLDGAIFGDHCSPLSDTTVLSSAACECDALSHVWTQLPYAVLAMLVATGGYVLVNAAGWALPLVYGCGVLALLSAMRWFGRRVVTAAPLDQ